MIAPATTAAALAAPANAIRATREPRQATRMPRILPADLYAAAAARYWTGNCQTLGDDDAWMFDLSSGGRTA